LAASAVTLDQSFVSISGEPFTIMRTRGILTIESDQFAATENPFGAMGMAVVSEEALAAGVTAVPQPYSNSESDLFFVHQFFWSQFVFGDATGFSTDAHSFEFDSKAMRKVQPEERIVVVLENGSNAFGLNFLLNFRMLMKSA